MPEAIASGISSGLRPAGWLPLFMRGALAMGPRCPSLENATIGKRREHPSLPRAIYHMPCATVTHATCLASRDSGDMSREPRLERRPGLLVARVPGPRGQSALARDDDGPRSRGNEKYGRTRPRLAHQGGSSGRSGARNAPAPRSSRQARKRLTMTTRSQYMVVPKGEYDQGEVRAYRACRCSFASRRVVASERGDDLVACGDCWLRIRRGRRHRASVCVRSNSRRR